MGIPSGCFKQTKLADSVKYGMRPKEGKIFHLSLDFTDQIGFPKNKEEIVAEHELFLFLSFKKEDGSYSTKCVVLKPVAYYNWE